MYLHNQLVNRLVIDGVLVLETGLHIGTSENTQVANGAVIRDLYGNPFIPGSSLKGAFRARVENLAHLVDARTCYSRRTGKEKLIACLSSHDGGAREILDVANTGDDARLAQFLEEEMCDVCRLFGGASWRGRVAFDDLHLVDETLVPIERRDGVGLDRDSRRAVDGIKYNFEAVPAETRFALSLTAESLSENERLLLIIGLMEMVSGALPLGGKTSRGLGRCRLDAAASRVTETDFTNKDRIAAFFARRGETDDAPTLEAWLGAQQSLFERVVGG